MEVSLAPTDYTDTLDKPSLKVDDESTLGSAPTALHYGFIRELKATQGVTKADGQADRVTFAVSLTIAFSAIPIGPQNPDLVK